jgi:polar amino acid transport system substrate-binding protein
MKDVGISMSTPLKGILLHSYGRFPLMLKTAALLILFFSLSISPLFGGEPIKIAVDDANPPFMYKKGDRAAGLYPFIIRYIFKSLQIPVVISPMPWKRALRYADNGEIGIAGIYKNEDRVRGYDYSNEIFEEKLVIFVHKEMSLNYKAISDLKGRTMGVISGWSYGDEFDHYRRQNLFIVDEAQSDEANFHKLL